MFKLDSKIKTCTTCQGWGVSEGQMDIPCSECNGKGVYIEDENIIKIFDTPSFVDFGIRRKAALTRNILIIAITTFIILCLVTSIIIIV